MRAPSSSRPLRSAAGRCWPGCVPSASRPRSVSRAPAAIGRWAGPLSGPPRRGGRRGDPAQPAGSPARQARTVDAVAIGLLRRTGRRERPTPTSCGVSRRPIASQSRRPGESTRGAEPGVSTDGPRYLHDFLRSGGRRVRTRGIPRTQPPVALTSRTCRIASCTPSVHGSPCPGRMRSAEIPSRRVSDPTAWAASAVKGAT